MQYAVTKNFDWRQLRTLGIALLLPLFLASSAKADMILGFSLDGQTQQFSVNTAQAINVPIYLIQSAGESRLTEFGIVSFGLSGRFQSSTVTVEGFTFTSAFTDFREFTSTAGSFQVFGNVPFNAVGPNPGLVPAKGAPLLLGTLSLRTTGAGETLFHVGDYDPSQPSFSDFSFAGAASVDSLDHVLFNSDSQKTYSFTVNQITAVPEPNSILGGVALVAMALMQRFRVRRRQALL